jgi:quinol monooxygenase YgiN
MVIVAGSFELEPSDRDEFLASRLEMMRASRAEPGCIEYTFSADPIDPRRVVLFERWESQAALDAHLDNLRARADSPGRVAPVASSITIYDVVGERQLGG